MGSYSHPLLLFLSLFLFITSNNLVVIAAQTTVDERCLLTGMPAQEPAETTVYYNLRSFMKCVARTGTYDSNDLTTYTYTRNKNNKYIVSSAVLTLRKDMLDGGINTGTAVALTYVDLLAAQTETSRVYVVGNVVGKSLGGSDILQNVFPMSTQTKISADYAAFESKIYSCIKNDYASSAFLRWTFHYRTSIDTAPYKIIYKAKFHDSTSSDCKDLKMTFDN